MGRFSRLETGQPGHGGEDPDDPLGSCRIDHAYPRAPGDEAGENLTVEICLAKGAEAMFRGESKPALRWYGRAIDIDAAATEPWVGMLRVLLLTGNLAEAGTWVHRGLTLFPDLPELLAMRAVMLARRGMVRDAMALTDALLERNSNLALVHVARGEVLALAGGRGWERCLRQGLELVPGDDWATPLWITLILRERRLDARALQYALKAQERNPHSPTIWMVIGQCHGRLGRRSQARKALARARELCEPDDILLARIDRVEPGSILRRLLCLFR